MYLLGLFQGSKWENRGQQDGNINISTAHISLHGSVPIGSMYAIFMIYLPTSG